MYLLNLIPGFIYAVIHKRGSNLGLMYSKRHKENHHK